MPDYPHFFIDANSLKNSEPSISTAADKLENKKRLTENERVTLEMLKVLLRLCTWEPLIFHQESLYWTQMDLSLHTKELQKQLTKYLVYFKTKVW